MLFGRESIIFQDHGGDWLYEPSVFSAGEAEKLFLILRDELAWRREEITLFGRKVMQPRMTALYGETPYTYSGLRMNPDPFTPELSLIRKRVEDICGTSFNAVLCNLYRNGNDSMGWHSDDERELGTNPVIASVSFGAVRKFRLRHKTDKNLPVQTLHLEPGSLLVMRGSTQHFWKHEVPKEPKIADARINLTFRYIYP